VNHRPFESGTLSLAAALLAALALAACGQEAPVAEAPAVRPAHVVAVRPGGDASLAFVGEVRAAQRAELAFPVTGRVGEVQIEIGDRVRRGQVLAVLDRRPLAAQLAAADSDLVRAQAQFAESRARLDRLQEAIQADSASATEAGAARLEVATAESALHAAQASRASAAWSLEQASLRAPIDGGVGLRNIEVGQAVGPGAPVLTIDGAGRELVIPVPESLALRAGQAVRLRGTSDVQSRILRIASRLDAGGVRRAWVAVPGDAQVGSTWSVALSPVAEAAIVQVPLRALVPDTAGDGARVLKLAKDGTTVESAKVRLGGAHGAWVDVVSGLVAGDQIIVAGAAVIAPGSRVKPVMVGE
jgi:RND family efflux transporter MFP subunit